MYVCVFVCVCVYVCVCLFVRLSGLMCVHSVNVYKFVYMYYHYMFTVFVFHFSLFYFGMCTVCASLCTSVFLFSMNIRLSIFHL